MCFNSIENLIKSELEISYHLLSILWRFFVVLLLLQFSCYLLMLSFLFDLLQKMIKHENSLLIIIVDFLLVNYYTGGKLKLM